LPCALACNRSMSTTGRRLDNKSGLLGEFDLMS
jgi:hypothetical protein